jgi:putative transposase
MGRPHRLQIPGGTYHLTQRGNNGGPIFYDDHDHRRLLRLFWRIAAESGWRCYAYCLMPNHYHFVLRTAAANLAAGMHRLNGAYAHRFNSRHGRFGHVFQGRYGARVIETEMYLGAAVAYVVENPVRAGLCERVEDWPWSWRYAGFGFGPSGTSQTTPSGGRVSSAEKGWSCHGTASDSTPPRLPTSEPP